MSQAAAATKPARAPRLPRPPVWLIGGAAAVVLTLLLAPALPRGPAGAVRLHAPDLARLAHASPLILVHLAAALTALGVGTALLAGVKGGRLHRTLGWTWIVAMAVTAGSSLFITESHPGRWSFIHFFSGWTLIALPMAVAAVKRRDIRLHRRMMTGLFVGGLLVAGAFTFMPGRLMFAVFFG